MKDDDAVLLRWKDDGVAGAGRVGVVGRREHRGHARAVRFHVGPGQRLTAAHGEHEVE